VAASGASGAADHRAGLVLLVLVLVMAALASKVLVATPRPAWASVRNDRD